MVACRSVTREVKSRELLYPALIAAYDRRRDATHVVDAGGGDGRFLAMLLGLHSHLTVRDLEAFLLHGDARERTLATYRSLLGNAGFDVNRVLPTATSWTIIEATPRR